MITAELVSAEEIQDPRKNMVIWVAFKKDGVEIPFYRGTELLIRDGKKVWPLYSRFENFLGKTLSQVIAWIKANVEEQIGNIIKEESKTLLNNNLMQQLNTLAGTTIQKDFVGFEIDKDNDGVIDSIITLKDDGTFTIRAK